MPVQLVRNGELRKPDDFTDTLNAASIAAVEGSSVDMTDFWQGILSQIKRVIYADAGGNWHDNPGSLGGKDASLAVLVARAKLEDKLGLHYRLQVADTTPPAAAYATEDLTFTGQAIDGDDVTIGTKTYTFQDILTDVDGNVHVGADTAESIDNLRAAVNLGAGAGVAYANSMTLHPKAGGTDTDTVLTATAKKAGTAGNSIASTQNMTNATWGAATLSGGTGDVVALTGAYKPDKVIAIANTQRGGVVKQLAGAIGTADLAENSGSNPLRPKNFVNIFDGDTGDPIQDADGRRIYALLQVGSAATDSNAFADAGNDQGQLTFVVATDTYDDLEIADGANIGGVNFAYSFTNRNDLQASPEESFRGDLESADPQAGVTISMDAAYNGGSLVDVDATDVDWRLADSLEFIIRKAGGNPLFRVVRDDGGTDLVQVGSDVDLFDVDAAGSNFAQGMAVDTADQTINIGKTAVGVIDSITAELRATTGNVKLAAAAGEVQFTSSRDANLELDDAVAGAISALAGGPHSSISAAIKYAITVGGVDLTLDQWDSAATYVKGANIPAVTLDLTAFSGDWNTIAGVNLFLFLNGRLLRGGNSGVGQENDWYPGTAPAAGDIKSHKNQPILSGDVFLTLAFKQ